MDDGRMHLQVGMDEILCEINGLLQSESGKTYTMTWRLDRVTCPDCLRINNQGVK